MGADTTAGAASTDARPTSAEGGAGGLVGDESPKKFRDGGIQRIESTWLRRASALAFWPVFLVIVVGVTILRIIVALIAAIVESGRVFREEARAWCDCVADLLKVSARGTALAWKRRR